MLIVKMNLIAEDTSMCNLMLYAVARQINASLQIIAVKPIH